MAICQEREHCMTRDALSNLAVTIYRFVTSLLLPIETWPVSQHLVGSLQIIMRLQQIALVLTVEAVITAHRLKHKLLVQAIQNLPTSFKTSTAQSMSQISSSRKRQWILKFKNNLQITRIENSRMRLHQKRKHQGSQHSYKLRSQHSLSNRPIGIVSSPKVNKQL